ncbi:MAG: hypothetical protein ABIS50_27000 [Luteolibacter sp.]|uniref:hypothetical protein n=1 Tax=Luteolibacter sp. TaxID=1962973 RepID=UPI00326564DF
MPDTAPITPTPAAAPQTRGYFNKAQLEDLDLAETVLAAARANAADLIDWDITSAYADGFDGVITETRKRAIESGQNAEDSKTATGLTGEAASHLHTALQSIQSAAKQKHKMLAEDGDPATNFPTDGYLIGSRLNGSRAILLQSAETLIARATDDNLPGFKTPEKIDAVSTLLTAYRGKSSDQQETTRDKEIARLDRDDLIHVLNTRRSAIQHAADSRWPWSNEANRPIRKTFGLPLTRPLGM